MLILLIENNSSDISLILGRLEDSHIIDVAHNARDGIYLSRSHEYDAIIISSELPDVSGYDVCNAIRSNNIRSPILFLSDRKGEKYLANAIECGADDFTTKPIKPLELESKIKSLIRRYKNTSYEKFLTFKDLRINLKTKEVFVKDKLINLRKMEYELLEYLVLNKNRIVSKDVLLTYVWRDMGFTLSNTVEVHIKRLRDKLEKPHKIKLIRTIRGFGYRFEE